MVDIKVKIDCGTEYCGNCEYVTVSSEYGDTECWCTIFGTKFEDVQYPKSPKRCQLCVDAELKG